MATVKELFDDVNNYWLGWDQRGDHPIDYDIEDGDMRRKTREFEERKKQTLARTAQFEESRNKYKRRDQ